MVKTLGNVHKCDVGNFAVAGAISRIFIIQNERLIKVGFLFSKYIIFSMRVTNWNYITDKSDITMQSDITMHSKKFFSNVVATSHSSCVFLYLFSSDNISPVRFVLHLQD